MDSDIPAWPARRSTTTRCCASRYLAVRKHERIIPGGMMMCQGVRISAKRAKVLSNLGGRSTCEHGGAVRGDHAVQVSTRCTRGARGSTTYQRCRTGFAAAQACLRRREAQNAAAQVQVLCTRNTVTFESRTTTGRRRQVKPRQVASFVSKCTRSLVAWPQQPQASFGGPRGLPALALAGTEQYPVTSPARSRSSQVQPYFIAAPWASERWCCRGRSGVEGPAGRGGPAEGRGRRRDRVRVSACARPTA